MNKDSSGTVLSSYSYTYDNVGNRLSVTEQDGSVVIYGYDNIYQLTYETRTGTNPYTITYQYDSVGNRTQMIKNAVTTSYTYNNNQLTAETTGGATFWYSYDFKGNLFSKRIGSDITYYKWDWGNRLLSIYRLGGNIALYEYDGDGTRISKTQAGIKTKYINDVAFSLVQVLLETDNTGTVQASYNYGNDLISMNRAGANSYYNYDGLGTVKQMTDSSEAVIVSYTYDSWGNLIASYGAAVNTYGFTGEQQFNEASNLVFLRARYYYTSVGRFISRDPIGYEDSMNLFSYCVNDPVNSTDPSGTKIKPPRGAAAASCVAAVVAACGVLCGSDPVWDCPDDTRWDCMKKCMSTVFDPRKSFGSEGNWAIRRVVIACVLAIEIGF